MKKRIRRTFKNTRKKRHRRLGKAGAPPGTVQAHPGAQPTHLRVMAYSADRVEERTVSSVQEITKLKQQWPNVWVDVCGLGSPEKILEIGNQFGLHPLALEDVVNVHQRAKLEEYTDYLFAVVRMSVAEEGHETEQVSIFLMQGTLITFQEHPGDCWEGVRARIRAGKNQIRSAQVDYLMYALIDSTLDSYFPNVDRIGDQLDDYDASVEFNAGVDDEGFQELHNVRHRLLSLRKALRPHREMINEIIRNGHALIAPETLVFFRDCYDHTIQLLDMVDNYRDLTADLREYRMSLASTRMNEVMQLLTIISTIFIPLSFIAGLYGMNFNTQHAWNMPELDWPYGYFFSLSLMVTIAGAMLVFFKRKGWF